VFVRCETMAQFVWREGRGHEQDLVQSQQARGGPSGAEVPDVNGIERSAE